MIQRGGEVVIRMLANVQLECPRTVYTDLSGLFCKKSGETCPPSMQTSTRSTAFSPES